MIYIRTKISSKMHQKPPFHSFRLKIFFGEDPRISYYTGGDISTCLGNNLPLVTELSKYTGLWLTWMRCLT